jgi:type I restriction enzyme S subunit
MKGPFNSSWKKPKNWDVVAIKDVTSDWRGGAPFKPDDFTDEGFPVLHKGAVHRNGTVVIDDKKKTYTSESYAQAHQKSVIDISYMAATLRDLVPSGPSIGLMADLKASASEKYILAQGAYGFQVDSERVVPSYLVWLSNYEPFREYMKRYAVGSTQIHIRTPVFQSFKLPLPPIAEQQRIAAILDKADGVRRKRKEAIALTEELLRSVFLDMFGDPVTNPKGWELRNLGEISKIQGGLQVTSKRQDNPLEAPYLRVANVYRDRLSLDEIKMIRVTQNELERVKLEVGDLLVVEGHGNNQEIGRSSVWDGSIQNCVHQNHLIRVRVSSDKADPTYVSAYLNSPGGRRQLTKFGKTTSGLNTISASNVKATKVLCPPLEMQRRYLDFQKKLIKAKSADTKHLEGTDNLFNSLLQRAFRGEL